MTHFINQLLELTGRLIEGILNWPFLLFAFAVWLVLRYRDQIGSILDRRGTVKLGAIHKTVRIELEPILAEFESLKTAFGEIKAKVDGLIALNFDTRLLNALQVADVQFSRLEEASRTIRRELDRVVCTHIPEMFVIERTKTENLISVLQAELTKLGSQLDVLQKEMDNYRHVVFAEISLLRQALHTTESELRNVATSIEANFRGQLDALTTETQTLRSSIDQLGHDVHQAASLKALSSLERKVQPLAVDVSNLRDSLTTFASELRSTTSSLQSDFTSQIVQIATETELLKSTIEKITRDLNETASRETVEGFQRSFASLLEDVSTLKAAVGHLDDRFRSITTEFLEQITAQLKTLRHDFDSLKSSGGGSVINQTVGSPRRASRRAKDARK